MLFTDEDWAHQITYPLAHLASSSIHLHFFVSTLCLEHYELLAWKTCLKPGTSSNNTYLPRSMQQTGAKASEIIFHPSDRKKYRIRVVISVASLCHLRSVKQQELQLVSLWAPVMCKLALVSLYLCMYAWISRLGLTAATSSTNWIWIIIVSIISCNSQLVKIIVHFQIIFTVIFNSFNVLPWYFIWYWYVLFCPTGMKIIFLSWPWTQTSY